MRARIQLRSSIIALLFATSAHHAWAEERLPAVPIAQASRELQRAARVQALLVENHIVTRLDGTSEGYVLIDAQIETREKFHIYEERVSFWTEGDAKLDGHEWKLEVVERPATVLFPDPVSKKLKSGYQGQAVFRLKLSLPTPTTNPLPAGHLLPLVVSFQACNATQCLFPAALRLDVPLGGAQAAAQAKARAAPTGLVDRAVGALKRRLGSGQIGWGAVLILLLAGLLTAFTPCVYPLYPVTLGVFGRWSAAAHVSSFLLALAYCAGLTTSYALAGLLSVASGHVFGSLTQTPGFLIGVGALILVSALAFSGLFEFPVPGFLQRFFAAPVKDPRGGPRATQLALCAKAFSMGAGLGVVAAPCVGPVLVAVLAWLSTAIAAGRGSYFTGAWLLAVFGAGMSLPFLVLGHFILRLGKHPRLGRFTPWFKNAGTALMVAAALSFLVPGLRLAFSQASVQTPLPYPVGTLATWDKTRWTVIDFRADWCAACVEFEMETLHEPAVAHFFDPRVPRHWNYISVDLTASTLANRRLAQDFGVVSLPTVLIFAPSGRPCPKLSLYFFETAAEFQARLDRAATACMSP